MLVRELGRTKENAREHIKNPQHCPLCLSKKIEERNELTDFKMIVIEMSCSNCMAKWDEIYRLDNIHITNEGLMKRKSYRI